MFILNKEEKVREAIKLSALHGYSLSFQDKKYKFKKHLILMGISIVDHFEFDHDTIKDIPEDDFLNTLQRLLETKSKQLHESLNDLMEAQKEDYFNI